MVSHGTSFRCQNKNHRCGGILTDPKQDCDVCGMSHCLECRSLQHLGRNCRENQRAALASVVQNLEAIACDDIKACPHCLALIQRVSGCNSMRCVECGCGFCWLCGTLTADVDDILKGWTRDMMHAHFSPCANYEIKEVIPEMTHKVVLRQNEECLLSMFSAKQRTAYYKYPSIHRISNIMFKSTYEV